LVAVHGLGDTPESFLSLYDQLDVPVRIVAPRAPDPHGGGSSWYPIDDPTRAEGAIVARAKLLSRFIEQVRAVRPTRGATVVTGFSQGGVMSFALAAYHSRGLAAAFPIAGMLPTVGPRPERAAGGFRVVALHGREDARIPYAQGERAVKRLQEAGIAAQMVAFASVGHTISEPMRERYHALLREELSGPRRPRD
jgi:phospholipase/carboxylesterase